MPQPPAKKTPSEPGLGHPISPLDFAGNIGAKMFARFMLQLLGQGLQDEFLPSENNMKARDNVAMESEDQPWGSNGTVTDEEWESSVPADEIPSAGDEEYNQYLQMRERNGIKDDWKPGGFQDDKHDMLQMMDDMDMNAGSFGGIKYLRQGPKGTNEGPINDLIQALMMRARNANKPGIVPKE